MNYLTGVTVDINAFLPFHFWQKVYYKAIDYHFALDSVEKVGHIVDISVHCGHALTYQIFNPGTKNNINQSHTIRLSKKG